MRGSSSSVLKTRMLVILLLVCATQKPRQAQLQPRYIDLAQRPTSGMARDLIHGTQQYVKVV